MSGYDRAWLEGLSVAERPRFLLFWGHQPSGDGRVTASCLSQWWPAPFEVGGDRYATAEHWMMAEKARLFGDAAMKAAILEAGSPQQAKQLGREVSGFSAEVWDDHKRDIVTEGSFQKFRQNPDLRDFLLATGDSVLVEASPRDRIWGIGMAASNAAAADPSRWRGENLLGFALMEARDRLRG